MSDLLGIGTSGLAAYRNALSAVGENVANANTPGYARRRVILEQSQITSRGDIAYGQQTLFNGVRTVGVERAWDAFKATEARTATSGAARGEVRQQWLTNVEGALGDGGAGVGASLTRFFNAATSLAADPSAPLGRVAMLTALEDGATAFRNTADALGRVSEAVAESAESEIAALNGALAALRDLNGAIRAAARGGSAGASLEDQRDRLIDHIAERIDVTVRINGDGTAAITARGDANVVLLGPDRAALFSSARALDGRISVQVSAGGTTLSAPIGGGRLAGLADVAATTADKRAALDALAADVVATINGWNAGGLDANGAAGADLLAAPAGAASLRLVVTDPDRIAAASADGRPNGNLLDLEAVREASGVEDRWAGIVSGHAQSLASAKAEAAASAAWRDLSRAALDEVTGVDLDQEAAELLRYQQAYNASARIIQVAREAIDALFAAL